MNNFWLKLVVWTKVTLLVILVTYVALFTFFNLSKQTEIWLFPSWVSSTYSGTLNTSVLLLALGAFVFGVIVTFLTRTILRTATQIRAMQRRKMEKEAAAIIARAAKLQVRQPPVSNTATNAPQGFPVIPSESTTHKA